MLNFVKKPINIQSSGLVACCCALLLLACNLSFWQQTTAVYPFNLANSGFLAALCLLVICVNYVLLSLFNFKYLLKPVLIFLLFISAISAYAMDSYGYIISTQAFENILQTDRREVYDLLTWKLFLYLSGIFIIPACIILSCKIKYITARRLTVHLLITAMLIITNLVVFSKNYTSFLRNHKQIRYYLNPVRPVYSGIKYASMHLRASSDVSFKILDPAPSLLAHTGKPRLIVLVVGEADRAANQYLNGYSRQTNPLLSARNDIYNFSNFYSCGTETSVSVPCMFSAYTREEFTYAKGRYTENLVDILHKSQIQVLWRDNDSGCKNVCDRIAVDDFNDAKIVPYCNDFECLDEVLFHELDKFMDGSVGDKLIVLHKKGNHGPAYFKRYPERFAVFQPSCQSNELQDCTIEQIVNAYDNVVLYTDYFLNKIITDLERHTDKYQTAMIYVSDHGESLGENGIYLHAMPYWLAPKEQIHIPFVFWASKDFAVDREYLTATQHRPLSHDFLFHSVLGLFKVKTTAYQEQFDLFIKK